MNNTLTAEIQKVIDRMKTIDPLEEGYSDLIEYLKDLVNIYDQMDAIQSDTGDKMIFLMNGGI
jgi:sulfur transfer protein SufE